MRLYKTKPQKNQKNLKFRKDAKQFLAMCVRLNDQVKLRFHGRANPLCSSGEQLGRAKSLPSSSSKRAAGDVQKEKATSCTMDLHVRGNAA
jgi:hypothetical protein